ncbi:MAG: tyrosine-protein kinase family protein [Bacilli bacterium]|nr:tyrosine-protein kinase family protein [Bacilli bacterium]
MALNKAKVITVTSVKGGTGKTTTAINLANLISKNNKKTIILDFDLYSGAVSTLLNINHTQDIYTLNEDMMNNRFNEFKDYTSSLNENLDVLSAPIDPRSVSKISAKFIDILLTRLELQYDVIIIDTNHILDKTNLTAFDHSTYILYVITNDLIDIKNMKTMITIHEDMESNNYKIILNESRSANTSYTPYEIKNILGKDIDYIIPKSFYIKQIDKFIYNGKILTEDKMILNSKGGKELEKITKDILG